MSHASFKQKYGPWALVAGGSEGLGGAWSDALASRGLNLVVASHDEPSLKAKVDALSERGCHARPVLVDLASDTLLETITKVTDDLEIGFLVYNAGFADLCTFVNQPLEKEIYRLNLNCRGPMVLSHHFGKLMTGRGKGGIVLMSSLGGLMGNPYNVGYAASKAYDYVLAEGLWYEFRQKGVDVIGCVAGLTKTTDAITDDMASGGGKPMDPNEVVDETLASLGKVPTMSPGKHNRLLRFLLSRILPRKKAIRFIAKSYEKNFPDDIAG